MKQKFKFELRSIVRHKTLGFKGKIRGRAEYANGRLMYGIRLTDDSEWARRQNFRWILERLLTLDKEEQDGNRFNSNSK